MRITILGGAGGMGVWFARFFKENNCDVRIVDIGDVTETVAQRLGVEFSMLNVLETEVEALKTVFADTDVVIVSVPIAITGQVIERVGPALFEGSLLMDITSVKKMPVALMENYTDTGVEVLGTHPLFGPSTKSMRGMPVIFVPVRKGERYEKIYRLFERNGAKIKFVTAAEHDELMAVIQGLPHFVLFSYGIALKELDFDVERAREFMGPMYDVFMDFVGRLLHQDPYLYAQIQTNFEMRTTHEAFLAAAARLAKLVSEGNVNGIVEELKMARSHFGNTERAMRDSDRMIEEKVNHNLFIEGKDLSERKKRRMVE